MPKKRPPHETWAHIREIIWIRDNRECVRCRAPIGLRAAHIDHIQSGKYGTNRFRNLRCLCRRCHVLRADLRHAGMVASALADGIIPPNWRELVWDG
jgi:5-methylcytosine-specific restriction endonuclease McrA